MRSAEGAHINKSLLALSSCINALVEGCARSTIEEMLVAQGSSAKIEIVPTQQRGAALPLIPEGMQRTNVCV